MGGKNSDKPLVVRSHRMIIVIVILGIALVVAGLAVWQWQNTQNQQTKEVDAALAQFDTAYGKAEYLKAFNLVRYLGDKATTKEQKLRVYQDAAQAATGANRLEEALPFYELKHQLDPSTIEADAFTLGTIYERLGKKDQALAQYKIALQYAEKTKNEYVSDVASVQAAIDGLEGKK